MGDAKATSFYLPPGCRFYPSEEQLLCYYLSRKNTAASDESDPGDNGYDLIKELDLYDRDPFDLPDYACYSYGRGGRRRHWFCYTVRVLKERRARSGYWKRKGRVRDVVGGGGGGGKAVLGRRSSFVFYLGNSPKTAVRTDWVLYQYAQVDHLQASFVLCRVFVRSQGGTNISENGLSSCAEETVSTVRHIGIQHDGFYTPHIVPEIDGDKSVPRNTDKSKDQKRPETEVDKQVETRLVSSIQTNGQVPLLSVSNPVLLDGLSSEHLLSLIEGDFIELDDLID
ncbi:PREDICTED: NAC domain-containing protein 72-like [Fragaria vesca subsp. vesca]|uniref:NAC domain-containing protein 72-like n=1 Tax=Fragaria vesca subsp. vesca TaxID=101020 RepID=UPI0002C2E7BC|nr:PREDICTED: NAC domain-containing protein 72-like [Fragaria vesca subsp. vesca]XP_011458921.1 PREDICTED: NAC domain-containing protein 72-like [Fragaria vesca subsp. vesca]